MIVQGYLLANQPTSLKIPFTSTFENLLENIEMQEYIPWSDDLSVGLQEIDEQHKILIRLINRLYDEAILKKADQPAINDILNELIQYTIIHFSVEESLFRIFDYPDTDSHQKKHENLKKQVIEIYNKFRDGVPVDLELMRFLRHWIKHHIMIDDKKYTPFFLEKGIKSNWPKQRSWIWRIWNSAYV